MRWKPKSRRTPSSKISPPAGGTTYLQDVGRLVTADQIANTRTPLHQFTDHRMASVKVKTVYRGRVILEAAG